MGQTEITVTAVTLTEARRVYGAMSETQIVQPNSCVIRSGMSIQLSAHKKTRSSLMISAESIEVARPKPDLAKSVRDGIPRSHTFTMTTARTLEQMVIIVFVEIQTVSRKPYGVTRPIRKLHGNFVTRLVTLRQTRATIRTKSSKALKTQNIEDVRHKVGLENHVSLGTQRPRPTMGIGWRRFKLMETTATAEILKAKKNQFGVMSGILRTQLKSSAIQSATPKPRRTYPASVVIATKLSGESMTLATEDASRPLSTARHVNSGMSKHPIRTATCPLNLVQTGAITTAGTRMPSNRPSGAIL